MKNQQNFKGMIQNDSNIKHGISLKERIEEIPEDTILFRSDFPEYHFEYVGGTFAELTQNGILVKISQGVYAKPRKSRFGIVLPSVEKIIQAISTRDNAEVLPSGVTALNVLGLSTQIPINYTYLTTGSERNIKLNNKEIVLKRGVPKNFCYQTKLAALLVQALKALKQNNIHNKEIQIIRHLISKEPNKPTFFKDVDKMPAWIKRIIKPMLYEYGNNVV